MNNDPLFKWVGGIVGTLLTVFLIFLLSSLPETMAEPVVKDHNREVQAHSGLFRDLENEVYSNREAIGRIIQAAGAAKEDRKEIKEAQKETNKLLREVLRRQES